MGSWQCTMEALGLMLINREYWAGKRVLLTGHTGFKGSWLALWLCEMGASVTGVGLEPDTKPNLFGQLELAQRLERHHIADIREAQALAKIAQDCQPQVVFHLAAQPLVRRSFRDPLGTWATNVQGSLHLLEALKPLQHCCAIVMVTTDKVYKNQEWDYGYRENDRLGGHDPYSASKAAAELAIASWRSSFCGRNSNQTPHLAIATARAGNVIGGGDWAEDRLIPDLMRSVHNNDILSIRNPGATRPWQHVLECLNGYLHLAEYIGKSPGIIDSLNFGPEHTGNQSVQRVINECRKIFPNIATRTNNEIVTFSESTLLNLCTDKAKNLLKWRPLLTFEETIEMTCNWYRNFLFGEQSAEELILKDIYKYLSKSMASCQT